MEIELFPIANLAVKIYLKYLPAALYFEFFGMIINDQFFGFKSKDLASVTEQGQNVCGNSCMTSTELMFLNLWSSNSALSFTFHNPISHYVCFFYFKNNGTCTNNSAVMLIKYSRAFFFVFAQNFPKYKSSREDNLREENGMSNLYRENL